MKMPNQHSAPSGRRPTLRMDNGGMLDKMHAFTLQQVHNAGTDIANQSLPAIGMDADTAAASAKIRVNRLRRPGQPQEVGMEDGGEIHAWGGFTMPKRQPTMWEKMAQDAMAQRKAAEQHQQSFNDDAMEQFQQPDAAPQPTLQARPTAHAIPNSAHGASNYEAPPIQFSPSAGAGRGVSGFGPAADAAGAGRGTINNYGGTPQGPGAPAAPPAQTFALRNPGAVANQTLSPGYQAPAKPNSFGDAAAAANSPTAVKRADGTSYEWSTAGKSNGRPIDQDMNAANGLANSGSLNSSSIYSRAMDAGRASDPANRTGNNYTGSSAPPIPSAMKTSIANDQLKPPVALREGGEIHAADGIGTRMWQIATGQRPLPKAPAQTTPQPAPAPAPRQETPAPMGSQTVLDARMKAAGLRNGGSVSIDHGQGGKVPGHGHGDKIPAKYEPGEFVVSNDMLDADPNLRGELQTLRKHVLAAKGMTPEQADAKAIGHKGLRAYRGYDSLGNVVDIAGPGKQFEADTGYGRTAQAGPAPGTIDFDAPAPVRSSKRAAPGYGPGTGYDRSEIHTSNARATGKVSSSPIADLAGWKNGTAAAEQLYGEAANPSGPKFASDVNGKGPAAGPKAPPTLNSATSIDGTVGQGAEPGHKPGFQDHFAPEPEAAPKGKMSLREMGAATGRGVGHAGAITGEVVGEAGKRTGAALLRNQNGILSTATGFLPNLAAYGDENGDKNLTLGEKVRLGITNGAEALGAGVGTTFGAGVGSVAPGPGTIIGGIAGGTAGYKAGHWLGDALTGSDRMLRNKGFNGERSIIDMGVDAFNGKNVHEIFGGQNADGSVTPPPTAKAPAVEATPAEKDHTADNAAMIAKANAQNPSLATNDSVAAANASDVKARSALRDQQYEADQKQAAYDAKFGPSGWKTQADNMSAMQRDSQYQQALNGEIKDPRVLAAIMHGRDKEMDLRGHQVAADAQRYGADVGLRGHMYTADANARTARAQAMAEAYYKNREYEAGRGDKAFEQQQAADKSWMEHTNNLFQTPSPDGKGMVPDAQKGARYRASVDHTIGELVAKHKNSPDPAKRAQAKELEHKRYAALGAEDMAILPKLFEAQERHGASFGNFLGSQGDASRNLFDYKDVGEQKGTVFQNRRQLAGGQTMPTAVADYGTEASLVLPNWGQRSNYLRSN